MRPWILTILAVVIAGPFASAQHGRAEESALYAFNYRGDTWTGIVTAVDAATRGITLAYDDKGKHENFTGVLKPPVEIVDEGGKPSKVRRINDGDKIEIYYLPKGMKVHEYKKPDYVADSNLIFKIKILEVAQRP
jgi:hypothetical protein